MELRFTLVSDGSTDAALCHILRWSLLAHQVVHPIVATWAELRRLRNPPTGLEARIRASLDLYPCELLFVHRDAERESPDGRRDEIRRAVDAACGVTPPAVCVVPVRMTEA